MKRCPTCQRTYADDTLRFCLEDGTALANVSQSSADQTLLMPSGGAESSEPPPTEILDFGAAPTVRAYDEDATGRRSKPAETARQQARPTIHELQHQVTPTAPPPRNTTSVVAFTAIATILVLAVGGLGAWLILRDKSGSGSSVTNTGTETVRVSNTSNAATPNGNTSGSTNTNTSTLPGTLPTPVTTPSATPSVTPQPTQSPADTSNARKEVMNALSGWTQTMRQADLDGHMAYYADTLHTYYMQSNYSSSRVRVNVAKAFAKYQTFDVKLSNIQIEVDAAGTSAVATFDKTFVFSGATTYSGSGLNRFWLEKIGGRWLITGEKDLKTYYVNND